jgi:acetyltransferase-like isoleucine patch superfamily enzyme
MSMTLGRGSYVGTPIKEYFNPTVKVGDFCSIADDITFCGAMNHACIRDRKMVNTYPFSRIYRIPAAPESYSRGEINIGHDVWIGTGSWIMDGVTIGNGAIIGARTMVTKDVPPYAVFVGNPGIIHHYRFTPEQVLALHKIGWWLWDDATLQTRIEDMKDIDIFIQKWGAK